MTEATANVELRYRGSMQLGRWVWVASMVVACGDNSASVEPAPDSSLPDAWKPGVECTGSQTNGYRIACASTAPASKPPECVRPAGVSWATPNNTNGRETLPLPAGFFSEDDYGCLYAIAYLDHIEVASFGCAFHTFVGDAFVPDGCGVFRATTVTCSAVAVAIEGCFTDGRPVAASGGLGITIDPVAGTATIGAGYDTSSSGPNTSCTDFCN